GGVVYVRAHEGTSLTNGGGALGLGVLSAGIALNVDLLNNTTTAEITDTAATKPSDRKAVFAAGGVEVSALSHEEVTTIAVGIGFFAGVAGAASGVRSTSTTTADVHDANVTSGAGLDVLANGTFVVHFYVGTLSAAVYVGAAGSVGVGVYSTTTTAYISGSHA